MSVVNLAEGGSHAERGLLAPEDEEIRVVVVAVGGHPAVRHAFHDGSGNEAFGRSHSHVGSDRVGEALRHVVGEPPTRRLAANKSDRARSFGGDSRIDLPRESRYRVVPVQALPFSFAALASACHRVHEAPRIVGNLWASLPLRANGASGARVSRHAARTDHPPVFDLDEYGAAVVAASAHRFDCWHGVPLSFQCGMTARPALSSARINSVDTIARRAVGGCRRFGYKVPDVSSFERVPLLPNRRPDALRKAIPGRIASRGVEGCTS